MKIYKSNIYKVISILILNMPVSAQYWYGNLEKFEFGDALYRSGGSGHGHNAVFLGLVKNSNLFNFKFAHTGGLKISGGKDEIVSSTRQFVSFNVPSLLNSYDNLIYKFIKNGEFDYYGSFYAENATPIDRNKIIKYPVQIVSDNPGYTFGDMIDPIGMWPFEGGLFGEVWQGYINQIDDIRCDGYTEYSYEKSGVMVSLNINITNPSLNDLYEHNNLHGGWFDLSGGSADKELCPMLQAHCNQLEHENVIDNHSIMKPSIALNPTNTLPEVSSRNIMRFSHELIVERFCDDYPDYDGRVWCWEETHWESTPMGSEPGAQIHFEVSDNASVKTFVLLQAKLPEETYWHVVKDNDIPGNECWEWKTVDLVEYKNGLQSSHIYVQWLGETKEGRTYTQSEMLRCMFRVIPIDQGGNIGDETITLPDLSGAITQNYEIDGSINITGDLTISDDAILTIKKGSNLYLHPGVGIFVEAGSKIMANDGTETEPIAFRRSGSGSWNRIQLYGDNNQFNYCVFDGGDYNVDIHSRGNTFNNCTFKNAERGFNSYIRANNSWSSFELDNCMIENNHYGVVAWHTYAAINNCTMQNNTSYGLSLLNSRLGNNSTYGDKCGLFTNNLIQNNDGFGINIVKNAKLWLSYGSNPGHNKIVNNDSHEIYIQSSTSARLYESNSGGYGSIYDNDEDSFYIYNLGKTWEGEQYVLVEVSAENNYWGWGSSGPTRENFYGPVDYTPYLTSDQTGNPGASGYPDNFNPGGSDDKQIELPADIKSSLASVSTAAGSSDDLTDLSNTLQALDDEIKENPNDPNNAGKLNEMYNLQADGDPGNKLGTKDNTMSILADYRNALMELDEKSTAQNPDSAAAVRINGETAMVLEMYDSNEKRDFKQTLEMAKKYDSYIKNSDSRREFLFVKLSAYEYTKQYEAALKVLEELKKEVQCDYKYYTTPTYETIEENLLEQLGNPKTSQSSLASSPGETLIEKLPEKFELHNNYPNPFNPVTKIPFSIPKDSRVKIEIFNTLGQRVAQLTNKNYNAGKHLVHFNGRNLASGIYFVRIRMRSLEEPKDNHIFTSKLILIK